ncbi:hypothetical protein FNAPI_7448 [Fusarium napiforme]|uniref:Uncharacterized protein n=1 Tax=Fusarium napiforme TaxID=42672 RepID=A0A8H5N2S1_9HYPO|nr:hypothetical protein FNAPI_7448 [Fusarium napiforme]
MIRSSSSEGPLTVESGPSEPPQHSSHNYPPQNSPPGAIQPHLPSYGLPWPVPQHQYPPRPPAPFAAHRYPPLAPSFFHAASAGTALEVLFFTGSYKATCQPCTPLPRPLSPQPKLEGGPDLSDSSTAPSAPASTAAIDPNKPRLLDAPFFESLVGVSVARLLR